MVARKNHQLRRDQGGRLAVLDQAKLHRQRLQAPERTQGLGFVVDAMLQAVGQGWVSQIGDAVQVKHGVHGKRAHTCAVAQEAKASLDALEQAHQHAGLKVLINHIGQAVDDGIQRASPRPAEGLHPVWVFEQAVHIHAKD
jgi:hypothetical protein